jgi:hypothetical protein
MATVNASPLAGPFKRFDESISRFQITSFAPFINVGPTMKPCFYWPEEIVPK